MGWNDVLYGGLGNDFVHGGEGDDAISGGEALAAYYTLDPWATLAQYYKTANLLQFGVRDPEEFLLYNENDPMRLVKVCPIGSTTGCLPFLTTADETGDDGDDALFGDGGNDWMSGGTGVDHLYGGWGHDLLDVDDDKTTINGSNNKVDGDGNADYAFGGAGRDVLIGEQQERPPHRLDRRVQLLPRAVQPVRCLHGLARLRPRRTPVPLRPVQGRRRRPDPGARQRPQRRALRRARADQLSGRRVGRPARRPRRPAARQRRHLQLRRGHGCPDRHHGVRREHRATTTTTTSPSVAATRHDQHRPHRLRDVSPRTRRAGR